MFRRILTTALLAGFLGGAAISVIQEFTTTPIILHAEQFEEGRHQHTAGSGAGHAPLVLARTAAANDAAPEQEEGWAPAEGLERTVFTAMSNIIAGVGFSLILVGCFALSGQAVDGRRGVLWGIGGFAIVSLAPALGLPPEVPGAMTAELSARQGWWLLCVAATGAGLWMLVFRPGALWIAAGIALLAAPHLIGAPQPGRIGGPVPPELAGHFAAASLVTAAVFWCLLGWLSGTFWRRSASTG